ncbi:unnamed protein product [Camellia sinensis]
MRIRERDTAEDLFDIVCGVLPTKGLGRDTISGWGDCPVEMSEATLDIERMIFKDLVGETIGDLVDSLEDGGEKIESKKHKKKKKKKKKKKDKGQKNKRFSSKDTVDAVVKWLKKKLKL